MESGLNTSIFMTCSVGGTPVPRDTTRPTFDEPAPFFASGLCTW